MFKSKNTHVSLSTVIGKDAMINGPITLKEGIRIDGHLQGDIKTEGFVSITQGAEVLGDISGFEILVAGKVKGNLTATHIIEVEKHAVIEGDLSSELLRIHTGAVINGALSMNKEKEEQ